MFPICEINTKTSFCAACFTFVGKAAVSQHLVKHQRKLRPDNTPVYFCPTCLVGHLDKPKPNSTQWDRLPWNGGLKRHRAQSHHALVVPNNFAKHVCTACLRTVAKGQENKHEDFSCNIITMERYCYSVVRVADMPKLKQTLSRFTSVDRMTTLPDYAKNKNTYIISVSDDSSDEDEDDTPAKVIEDKEDAVAAARIETDRALARDVCRDYTSCIRQLQDRSPIVYETLDEILVEDAVDGRPTIGPVWKLSDRLYMFVNSHKMVPIDKTPGFVLIDPKVALENFEEEVINGKLAYSNGFFIAQKASYGGVLNPQDVYSTASCAHEGDLCTVVPITWSVPTEYCRYTFIGAYSDVKDLDTDELIKLYNSRYIFHQYHTKASGAVMGKTKLIFNLQPAIIRTEDESSIGSQPGCDIINCDGCEPLHTAEEGFLTDEQVELTVIEPLEEDIAEEKLEICLIQDGDVLKVKSLTEQASHGKKLHCEPVAELTFQSEDEGFGDDVNVAPTWWELSEYDDFRDIDALALRMFLTEYMGAKWVEADA